MSERDDDDDDDRHHSAPPSLLAEASDSELDEVLRRNVDGLVREVTRPNAPATERPLPHRLLTRALAALGAVSQLERRGRGPAPEGTELGPALARVGRALSEVAAERGQAALARALGPLPELQFEVGALCARLMPWCGREVLVAGFPMTFFDPGRLGTIVKLHVSPDLDSTRPALVQGTLAAPDHALLRRSEALVVRGRISDAVRPWVELVECARVETLEALPEPSPAPTPDTLDGTRIVRADTLQAAARGLVGDEVLVRGRVSALVPVEGGGARLSLDDVEGGAESGSIVAELASVPPGGRVRPGLVVQVRARIGGEHARDLVLGHAELVRLDE